MEVSAISSGSESESIHHSHQQDEATSSPANAALPYVAARFAIKFTPPCLFLEYHAKQPNGGAHNKTRVRAVKLHSLSADMDLDRLTRKVIRSFPRKLDPSSVKYDQVRKLVAKLVERLQQQQQQQQQHSFSHPNDLELPRDRAPQTPLKFPPLVPSQSPGGARGGHDFAKGQERESTESRFSTSELGTCRAPPPQSEQQRHREMEEAMRQLDRELGLEDRGPSPAQTPPSHHQHHNHHNHSQQQQQQQQQKQGLPDSRPTPQANSLNSNGNRRNGGNRPKQEPEEEMLTLELDINEETDLNRVSEMELRIAKQQMDRDFSKHQLKPGDPGYEYDKQVEFGPPTSENDWDDDDD